MRAPAAPPRLGAGYACSSAPSPRLITRTDKTFIAAVKGPAAGVGPAFALAYDVILVSERARLVPAFARIGLLPEVGNSWPLTRRLGYQRSFALFAGGRHVSGAEAVELGLANELHRTRSCWMLRGVGVSASRGFRPT